MILRRENFKWHSIILPILMLGSLFGCQKTDTLSSKQEVLQTQGWRNEYAVLKYLLPVLKKNDKVGRIYYSTFCHADEGYPNLFPKIDVQSPSRNVTGLAAVLHIFRGQQNIAVTETPPGIIRIRVGRVSDAVLQTRISSITFSSIEQYNPSMAISALESSEDVHAAMNKLGIHVASRVTNLGIALPANGLPHLPGSLTNITMDQALDLIAQTFGGVVIYSDCSKSHSFMVDFIR